MKVQRRTRTRLRMPPSLSASSFRTCEVVSSSLWVPQDKVTTIYWHWVNLIGHIGY